MNARSPGHLTSMPMTAGGVVLLCVGTPRLPPNIYGLCLSCDLLTFSLIVQITGTRVEKYAIATSIK